MAIEKSKLMPVLADLGVFHVLLPTGRFLGDQAFIIM